MLADVTVYDRLALVHRTLPAADLALGYRTSVLRGTDTAVVTGIRLRLGREPRPVRYAELARTLGVEIGTPVPADAVRDAVLDLRRAKGMVIDPDDPDTRSAGSFFTNPILRGPELAATRAAIERRLGAEARCPTYPAAGRQQALRRVADRARRVRQGLRPAGQSAPPCRESTAWR